MDPVWLSEQIRITRMEIDAMELAIRQGGGVDDVESVAQSIAEPVEMAFVLRTVDTEMNMRETGTITATVESRGDDFRHAWARSGEPDYTDPEVRAIVDQLGSYSTSTLYMPELEERMMQATLAEKRKTLQVLTDEMIRYQQWRHYNEEARAMWP
jgi:hypothetical protein